MTIQAKTWKTGLRGLLLGATVVGVMPMAVGCLDRPVAPSSPRTSNTLTDQVKFSAVDKIDLLFMIDNSSSMADKQKVLAKAVPDLLSRLVTPNCLNGATVVGTADAKGACPAGSVPEFTAIRDIHIGVVTSSLGGHGADYCGTVADPNVANPNDGGHLITRQLVNGVQTSTPVPTYSDQGFLAWDPDSKQIPPGETGPDNLNTNFSALVQGADQKGCGFEASLEAFYRFLIDPRPPASVDLQTAGAPLGGAVNNGVDAVLLQQRAAFLRPDSLVSIVVLSDENDCSIIDGVMPPSVCDSPVFDDNGYPTGCKGGNTAWPANYARGNFQGYTLANGGVTGQPFPANNLSSQRNGFGGLICDGQGQTQFCIAPGTPACADNPDSADCRSCYLAPDGVCSSGPATKLPPSDDNLNLRCWNQKQRFGVDMLYPLQRYIAGLNAKSVYDREGYLVPNPLFDDLPYNFAKQNGTLAALGRSKSEARPTNLVFFATIVGVPWQDIAKNQGDLASGGSTAPDLKAGYLTATRGTNDPPETKTIDWDLILGNPFGFDGEARRNPKDPVMIESNVSTQRVGQPQPVTGETISAADANKWNSVNGHEWVPVGGGDLQYACIFDLQPDPSTGKYAACGTETKDTVAKSHNPLCEKPVSATDTSGNGTFDDLPLAYRAKAYPGTRFLQVAKSFGTNSIVASICSPNLRNEKDAQGNPTPDFGYRPAVTAIIDRLKTQLAGRCLPRTLATTKTKEGGTTAPCLIIDARFKLKDDKGQDLVNPPNDVNTCKQCATPAHKKLDPAVASLLTGDVKNYACLCEVEQFSGADLTTCQTDTDKNLASIGNDADKGGWCYVDPSSPDMPNHDAATTIVESCPSTQRRTIRFVNSNTENSTLYITCLGAATNSSTTDDDTGAAGTTGAAGSK